MHTNELKQKLLRYSVYDYTIVLLVLLCIWFIYSSGFSVVQQILIITLTATLVDEVIYYFKNKKTFIPKSAIITGLIISLLITSVPFWIQIAIPIIAIVLKHVLKYKNQPIFNPAALALVIAILFGTNVGWIGVSTYLAVLGFLIAYKIRRLRMSLYFLLTYYIVNLVVSTHHLPKIYVPDAITIFFATIMLVEPKTSPHNKYGFIVFGVGVAVLANLLSHIGSPIDPLLSALLIMNIFTYKLNKIKRD